MRNILAIGAYERDNFGDALFLEILKRLLPKDNVIPGSIVAADMTDEYGFVTVPYDFVLKNYVVDAVWVVGGEVGGVRIPNALDMTIGSEIGFHDTLPKEQIRQMKTILGMPMRGRRAYIPDLKAYPMNSNVPLIINSVGLSNLTADSKTNLRLIKNASFVSVRDRFSYEVINKVANQSFKTPDVVHCISQLYKPKRRKGSKYVVIQINAETINRFGIPTICRLIREISKSKKIPIRLLAAGTARGHDSLQLYQKIIKKTPDIDIDILTSRNPLVMVDYIARSELVVGTSLHLRIVAESYGVKRISLQNNKVSKYASEWDSEWPYDIPVTDIGDALRQIDATSKDAHVSVNLKHKVRETLDQALATIPPDSNRTPLLSDKMLSEWHIAQQYISYANIISNHERHRDDVNELVETIEKLQGELDKTRPLENSKLWKLVERSYRIKSRILNSTRILE